MKTSRLGINSILLVAALAVTLTGCITPDPGPTSSPSNSAVEVTPHVTLSAPPTINAEAPLALVIDSAGHDGEQVQLYAFPGPHDQPPTCADTTVIPTPITLTGGAQQITLNPIQDGGDVYWVLSGEGFTSQCGDSKTRVLQDPRVAVGPAGSSSWGSDSGHPVVQQSDPGDYRIIGRLSLDSTESLLVTVTWVGPFSTAPEANASPCPTSPIAVTEQVSLDPKDGEKSDQWNQVVSAPMPVPVLASGIYRILVESPATEYTFAQVPDCSTALLMTVE